jgi:ATP phosphoribosyltransferase
MEFDYPDLYAPLDLNIGHCRLSLAAAEGTELESLKRMSHVRVATKYPNIARKYFADLGIQAECIKLNGAMELAPSLGLTQYIVDLVSSGATLKANGLRELATIANVSSKLVMHRQTFKTRHTEMNEWLSRFSEAIGGA